MRDLQTATPHPSPSATITNCTGRGHAAEKHPLNLIRLAPPEGEGEGDTLIVADRNTQSRLRIDVIEHQPEQSDDFEL